MKATKVYEFILPAFWASYLINRDASSLGDEDLQAVNDFLQANGVKYCVGCEDVGFTATHDAFDFLPVAADCALFAFWA